MSRSHDDTTNDNCSEPSSEISGLTRQVRRLCADGYRLYDSAEYRLALRSFYQAWLIIPKPQTQHIEAGWVLTAIGDSYFRLGQYEQGAESLQSALCCPTAEQSPFVQLRLGQCLWQIGRHAEARKCLFHAYQSQGENLFATELECYRKAIEDLLPHD
ncbi:tetratricopeptide repeat protein [Gilvimarinus polysaccharolyticus]|uniref:tetratricopeptide repeat protein n=1 Tax=Gilvimarinus polysaccharolyticus TaxID=863921 RepID=UPI0012FA605C|nr:tetratricopeptide repeat protein [Gilvimarinus polysaccharolyticus]